MLISILSVALMGAPDCKSGQCQAPIRPSVHIVVPGVGVRVNVQHPRVVYEPLPVERYYVRGLFGKLKYKSKSKWRGWR
jgi:hypothetical protein